MSDDLSTAIVTLDKDATPGIVERRLASGEDALDILEDCRRGMTIVGNKFQEGEYYLAELILAAELFKEAVALLDPHLAGVQGSAPSGKIVLATMRGDIHDLGKNILATLLRVHAFEVHDLGVNVEPELLLEKVREVEPQLVGFSSLITASFESMKEAIGLLQDAGLRSDIKILLGGGVTSPELRNYLGADFQTLDAAAGVNFCVEAVGSVSHDG
ncbi:MAG: cobalamin-dependent protein [Deltaproteobacteria bacterium]|nr:cobalamin-dependent protein [Deltaproteobacteria bacterium]MBW2421961.1 cobalamin-dependent protein [Deltaproteobacteria bacterium]